MKKLIIALVAVAMVAFAADAKAYDGDFEMSGHINTGVGLQYFSKAATAPLAGGLNQEGMLAYNLQTSGNPAKAGQLVHKFDVAFYVGDVELDIAKTFGENIRLRADLDFIRAGSASFDGQFVNNVIEQAYATINIPVGYGLEFMVGRFNAPMGFEAVDNNDNDLPLHSMIFNFLRPQNLTGIKFYYPFSDMVDLHFWLANNLRDILPANAAGPAGTANPSMIPAVGLRLGLTWGMEGQESTVGLSGAFSMEAKTINRGDKWGEMSYLGDLDFNIWVNDVFAIGGEGIIRRDGAPNNVKQINRSATDNYYMAGLLNLHYVFSDVWDGTLRYTYVLDKAGSWFALGKGAATINSQPAAAQQYSKFAFSSATGLEQQQHDIDLGINYHITDGAKIMTMYRFGWIIPTKAVGAFGTTTRSYANGTKAGMAHTLAANFAYEF